MIDGSTSAHASVIRDSESPADSFAADWRVLLPSPPSGSYEHLLLIGGTASLGEFLVKIGVARQVLGEMPAEPIIARMELASRSMFLKCRGRSIKLDASKQNNRHSL